jgi:toxin ParE1/3/4
MAGFRLTKAAKRDLMEIARYTLERWGDEQRVRYLTQLDERFRWIAKHPRLGVDSAAIKPGYWRCHEGRHVIFYRIASKGVEIVRVLHERMLPTRHVS